MQFQVPQFIETEDKIVGPFSLKQFAYIGGAGGIVAVLYFIIQFWLWAPLAVVLVGIGAALALVKVNGRQLPAVLVAAARFYWEPQLYIWKPESARPQKKEAAAEEAARSFGFSLEKILAGMSLKTTWQKLQTEKKPGDFRPAMRAEDRYAIFQRITGERRAARRVDYR